MPTTARRRHRVGTGGPWGTGLLLLGIGLIAQGLGYIAAKRSGLPEALRFLSESLPMWFWGGLWIAAGAYSVWKALNPPQRHMDVGPAIAITALWSSAYAVQFVADCIDGDFASRAWSSSLGWAMLAGVISCLGRCVNPPRFDA